MSMKMRNTAKKYSRCMNVESWAPELSVTNDHTSEGEKKNKNGMMLSTKEAARKMSTRMIQLMALFLAAATFSPSPATSTLARLPNSLWVRLFAHSDSRFCGQAQPHHTMPMVM